MANTIHKAGIRFQAEGNVAEHAKAVAKSLDEVNKTLNKMGKEAKEATSVAAQGVEEFQNSVKNFAKSLVTIEAIKAGFQAVTQYVGEAVKKFQEAEIAAGKSLDQISKNATQLQKDMDALQVSVGRLVNALSEEALQPESNEKSFLSVVSSLIDKSSEFSDEILDVVKTLALINPVTGPVIVSFTVMGGLVEELTRKLDDMTGASRASIEQLEKLAKAAQKNVDRFGGRAVPIVPDVPEPGGAENPMLRRKMAGKSPGKKAQTDAEFLAGLPGFGSTSEADALQREFDAADAAKAKAEADAQAAAERQQALQAEFELREKIAGLQIEGRDLEAELAAINASKDLSPLERELAALNAVNAARERANDQLRQSTALQMTYVDAAQTGAQVIADAAGIENAAKIASAAIDGAQASYLAAIEFGLGNFAGAASLAAGAVQAFALAGSGVAGATGVGSAGKRKGRAQTSGTRPGAQARETAAASTGNTPSTTVYNVSFRSLTTPSPREARQIASALALDSRSRI